MKSFLLYIFSSTITCLTCTLVHGDQQNAIPLIDLENDRDTVVEQISKACSTVGFFMIKNHGIQNAHEMFTTSRDFFNLSTDQKLLHKTNNEATYPYGYEQTEQLVQGKQIEQQNTTTTTDYKETFSIGPNNIKSGMPPRRWISVKSLPDFQNTLEQYYQQMESLAMKLLYLFALALSQEDDYFLDKMDHHMSALRLVHYYPLPPDTSNANDDLVRAGAHTDYGALTILNAQKPGLQVLLPDQTWFSVPVIPDTLIINLGDLMQRWTNDKWVSTLHRVSMPLTDAMERRYSIAFFVNINGDSMVEPLDSCVEDGSDKSYPPILAKDHLMAKHLASMSSSSSSSKSSSSSSDEQNDNVQTEL